MFEGDTFSAAFLGDSSHEGKYHRIENGLSKDSEDACFPLCTDEKRRRIFSEKLQFSQKCSLQTIVSKK